MKVFELIEELKKFDPQLPVTVDSDSVDLFTFEIISVGISSVYSEDDYVTLYGNYKEESEGESE